MSGYFHAQLLCKVAAAAIVLGPLAAGASTAQASPSRRDWSFAVPTLLPQEGPNLLFAKKTGSKKKKRKKSGGENKKKKDSGPKVEAATNSWRMWAGYAPAIMTPAKFQKLSYAAASSESPESLWAADETIQSSMMGFALRVAIPWGKDKAIIPGLRYRTFTPSIVDVDYLTGTPNPFVRTEQKASALGLFADFEFLRAPSSKTLTIGYTVGLDFDRSSVSMTTTKQSDSDSVAVDNAELAEATSSLGVVSVRLGANLDVLFASAFGMSFGLNVLVPISELGKSFGATVAEAESKGLAAADEDLGAALGHGKSSLGADVMLAIVMIL